MTQGGGFSRLGTWATEKTSPTPVRNDLPASVGLDDVNGRISLEKQDNRTGGKAKGSPAQSVACFLLETCILLEVDIFMKRMSACL